MSPLQKTGVGILLALAAVPVFARFREPRYDPVGNAPLISAEKSGTILTRPGLCLRLNTDPGNVHIFTDESTQVSYRVIIEADSRDPGADDFLRQFNLEARQIAGGVSLDAGLPWRTFHGQFGVSFDVHVPRRYGLKIETQGGNIDVQDIDGPVDLATGGGNIMAGSVTPRSNAREAPGCPAANRAGSPAARLETKGGHISLGDVAGAVRATTSGGNITAGNIVGDANLHTGGGQIEAGRIAGLATLEAGGGNIRVESAESGVTANTGGGEIDFGEAAGQIHAHTGGGAVHIGHVTAPSTVETDGGGIFLGKLDAALHVSSEEGDIVAYLPRQLAATIDAVVDRSGGHSIISDPSLPLNISFPDSGPGQRTIRGEGNMNGGGEVVHLNAASGNIVLRPGEPRAGWNTAIRSPWMPGESDSPAMRAWNSDDEAEGFFEEVRRRILESWWGGVPVEANELQNHLVHSVAPVYPDVARKAGVEGDVVLRVNVSSEGRVTDIRTLDGPPILARAAVEAVRQWQYQGPVVNGRPANVVTTLVVAFRLH